MSTRHVPYWRSHSLLAQQLGLVERDAGRCLHLLRSVAISASAQHSFFETTASTRQPAAPAAGRKGSSAPASASSLLPSLTRAKTPPFFSTITPQHGLAAALRWRRRQGLRAGGRLDVAQGVQPMVGRQLIGRQADDQQEAQRREARRCLRCDRSPPAGLASRGPATALSRPAARASWARRPSPRRRALATLQQSLAPFADRLRTIVRRQLHRPIDRLQELVAIVAPWRPRRPAFARP